jgi:hypothetical protein
MAWETLTALVRTEPGTPEDPALAERVYRAFKGVDRDRRNDALTALAEAVAANGTASRLISALAALRRKTARYLAVLLAARLPVPLDAAVAVPLAPLLADRRIPTDARVGATAALLRVVDPAGPAVPVLLQAITRGIGKARALRRLRRLQRKTGPHSAIEQLATRLRDTLRVRCPRCGVAISRPQMAQHLWRKHQLILEGLRVREPWKLIEEWVDLSTQGGDATLLGRCQALAAQLDPANGLLRVYRMFLRKGINLDEARDTLQDDAFQRGACLCPRCFAAVSVRDEPSARPLNVSHGRIASPGYHVEVADHGFLARLEIEMPGDVVYRGPEPLWRLTRAGATLLIVGPPVVTALVVAVLLTVFHLPALVPVAVLLALALLACVFVRWRWRPRSDLLDRAIHYAWTLLVPALHEEEFSPADSEFIAGLALTSINHGEPLARARVLEHLLTVTERAVTAGTAPVAHLAVLWRLATEDALLGGHDPARWVTTQVARCFDGKLPLAFAQHLLAEWESNCWTRVNLARLRVLLCDRAFEAGFEVGDLADLGRVVPALADAMQIDDLHGLLQLRLLWSLRPTRPWDRCGEATTVFELAPEPERARKVLGEYPEVILASDGPPSAILTTRGVVFRSTLLTALPRTLGVRERRTMFGAGFELMIDQHRFWFNHDPEPVVNQLMEWLKFYFREFLPRLDEVRGWRSPGLPQALRGPETVHCPECGQALLGRRGEIGAAIRPAEGE